MGEWKWCFILASLCMNIAFVQSQTFQSIMTFQEMGTDFIPANPVELMASYTDIPTVMSCFTKCNMNPLCRTFVSDSTWPSVCRLYQGSIDTGTVIASLSSTSRVSGLHYHASLYKSYQQVCDPNLPSSDRYLICNNRVWDCPAGTYWDGVMCVNQIYYQASCNTNKACREDIGLSCLSSCNKCLCQSRTIWNSTSCVSSVCPAALPTDSNLLALWLLDGDAHDSMDNYNGTVIDSPSFVTGYIGQAVEFSNNGYINLSYISFYRRSFTLELWFHLTNITNKSMALFSECLGGIDNQCLHIGMNPIPTLHMGFWNDDIDGSTTLVANQWYHAAFVYNYDLRQQFIYLNGVPESRGMSGASHLYLGQSGNAVIGNIPVFSNGFVGYIDHVSITYHAKTDNEILDDASLVAYYSFDCGSTLDSGPNLLHTNANGQTTVVGRINDAVEFNSSNAYFQASGFTALGTSNQSFSISLWVKLLNTSGTLVHLSSASTGNGSCTTLLGFSASGNIIVQISNMNIYGPILASNVWTHVIQTFSVINGIRLYINGSLYASSGSSMGRDAPDVPFYVTIANLLLGGGGGCTFGNITKIPYRGAIDELRIYNREITTSEACMLSS